MSRQRIRAGVLESTMKPCPHCGGTGHVRSDSSVALHVVRAIEEFLLKDSRSHIIVKTPTATALYVLNHKRGTLVELERRFGVTITVEADETLGAQHYAIFRGAIVEKPVDHPDPLTALPAYPEPEEEIEVDVEEEEPAEAPAERPARRAVDPNVQAADHNRDRKRRRRRRRRGGRDREPGRHAAQAAHRAKAAMADAGARDHDPAVRMTVPTDGVNSRAGNDGRDCGQRPNARSGGAASAAANATVRKRLAEVVAPDTGMEIDTGAEVYAAEPVTARATRLPRSNRSRCRPEPEAAAKAKPPRAPRRTKKVVAGRAGCGRS